MLILLKGVDDTIILDLLMKITMEMFFLFALGLNVAFLGSVRKHLSFSNENIFICVCVISVKLFIDKND